MPDKAVRVFVEFKRVASAIKAVIDLNSMTGWMDRQQLNAVFYDPNRLKQFEFSD